MNLSVIAFGAMTGFTVLILVAIFLMERNSRPVNVPKPDIAEDQDENPFAKPFESVD